MLTESSEDGIVVRDPPFFEVQVHDVTERGQPSQDLPAELQKKEKESRIISCQKHSTEEWKPRGIFLLDSESIQSPNTF